MAGRGLVMQATERRAEAAARTYRRTTLTAMLVPPWNEAAPRLYLTLSWGSGIIPL